MSGMFMQRQGFGLDVGNDVVRAAGVRKKGGLYRVERMGSAELVPGLILDSFNEPNVTDMPTFVAALKRLVETAGGGVKDVKVSLPDFVSRVSILDFDAVQKRKEETERMIRWRVKKTTPFDVADAQLRFQYLGKFRANDKDQHRFLVSLIRSDILDQYEEAFRLAGLRPGNIGVSSFCIWNLYHDLVTRQAADQASFAMMNVYGGKMTVMVFDRGVPHFLRLKDIGRMYLAEEEESAFSARGLLKELTVSLTYYKENFGGSNPGKVFMTGDLEGFAGLAAEMTSESQYELSVLDIEDVVRPEGRHAGKGPELIVYSAACGAAIG